jgi:hypothetical protein
MDADWINHINNDIISFIYDDLKNSNLEKYLEI